MNNSNPPAHPQIDYGGDPSIQGLTKKGSYEPGVYMFIHLLAHPCMYARKEFGIIVLASIPAVCNSKRV